MRRDEEIDLIRKAKEGDTVAFTAMIRRYQNLVYATALRILKDTALAEDAAQEAFVAAFRSLPDLRAEGSFPPWLRKITRNLALAARGGNPGILTRAPSAPHAIVLERSNRQRTPRHSRRPAPLGVTASSQPGK